MWGFSLLLFLLGQTQVSAAEKANLPVSFHDDALNVTYFYPPHFTLSPDTVSSVDCSQTRLSAESHIASGLSSFTVSSMDATCPLPDTASLGVYTRQRLLSELKTRGEAEIIREPIRYFLDGHTATVTLATLTTHDQKITYAAKACTLDGVLLCFDYTTQNRDLLDLMFSFVVQFGDDAMEPLFPGSIRPRY